MAAVALAFEPDEEAAALTAPARAALQIDESELAEVKAPAPERRAPRGPELPRPQPKPRTLGSWGLTPAERREKKRLDRLEYPSVAARRRLPVLQMPTTRDGCADVSRPCPFIRCTKNLYLTRADDGIVKLAFPNLEPWEMDPKWSCSADVASRGPAMVEEVANALNMTDERVRQIQVGALRKLKVAAPWLLEELGGEMPCEAGFTQAKARERAP